MKLDIDERHLLRLGHGQEMLETDKNFSEKGRVNYMLGVRLELLKQVEKLTQSLGMPQNAAYSCESAHHFYKQNIHGIWEQFLQVLSEGKNTKKAVSDNFPFATYFAGSHPDLFKVRTYKQAMEQAENCYDEIKEMFVKIEECRAFEILRLEKDRSHYLLTKQAKIIAMTCTYAALKRRDLVKAGFKYDNILMEESAQILEVETFIPMLLQEQSIESGSRLKRIAMLGDHNQLPPVIQNIAFEKYCRMNQSLFTRFVRLGVPAINLDSQGRARTSIAALYNWRYPELGNLPVTEQGPFLKANSGFVYDYQMINVDDFMGQGCTTPTPFFYQNLGEAEYVVATYMYMRLLGYPREKISIITSYNGQKALLRDVLDQRCRNNPLFGMPARLATVDRFQGQQNDYILLSLVRTKHVGHIRDVRRLVVALSRARLGLYVFCRKELFQDCLELAPAFEILSKRPDTLSLVRDEDFNNCDRDLGAKVPKDKQIIVSDVLHMGKIVAPPPTPEENQEPTPMESEEPEANDEEDKPDAMEED